MFGTNVESLDLIKRLKSTLLLMRTKLWYMDVQGCGMSAKLTNNYVLAITNIDTSEALNMGREWGLDPHNLTEMSARLLAIAGKWKPTILFSV